MTHVTSPPRERIESGLRPYFVLGDRRLALYQGDSLEILEGLELEDSVHLIFADPPYFLSNGGITCQSGEMVSVNKGDWDRLDSIDAMHEFNRRWLALCRRLLRGNGTIAVSGTHHVIYSIGFAMQQLGFKILNVITWEKPNPPPNLSCRYFTHSTETVLWAAKNHKSKHTFNYDLMREVAGGKQMKSVWRMLPPQQREKAFGRHPTQKPIELIERIILAATKEGDVVCDPFLGSGTTALAALRTNRRCIGIEIDPTFIDLTIQRVNALVA